jgi:hypothetical protein
MAKGHASSMVVIADALVSPSAFGVGALAAGGHD